MPHVCRGFTAWGVHGNVLPRTSTLAAGRRSCPAWATRATISVSNTDISSGRDLWSCPLAPHEPAPNAHRRPRLVPHRCFSSDRCGHRPTVPVVTPLESVARRPPAGPPRRPLAADAATSRSTKPIGSNQSTLNHRLRPMRARSDACRLGDRTGPRLGIDDVGARRKLRTYTPAPPPVTSGDRSDDRRAVQAPMSRMGRLSGAGAQEAARAVRMAASAQSGASGTMVSMAFMDEGSCCRLSVVRALRRWVPLRVQ